MKITVLAENTSVREDIACEHGLSLYIETQGHKLLFDMGQGEVYAQNAQKLGIDLRAVDIAVVSHGHYDHGGGLEHFLRLNSKAKVYISRHAFGCFYNAQQQLIGLAPSLQTHPRLILTEGDTLMDEALSLHHQNDAPRLFDAADPTLTRLDAQQRVTDEFFHEQYLMVREAGKRVLISGCSHKGVLNLVSWFSPDVLIGGFHFFKLAPDDPRIDRACAFLEAQPTSFYTCHCTGQEQAQRMRGQMTRLWTLSGGQTVEL